VTEMITVEVAFAAPEEQKIIELKVPQGTTAKDAVISSKMKEHFDEIDLDALKLGIFGKLAKLDVELKTGDRVEIYRKLIADPKEARKKRAAEGKTMNKGAKAAGIAKA